MFKRLDKDGDRVISKEEFFSSPRMENLPDEKRERLFMRFDTDQDGTISIGEIRQMRKNAEEQRMREFRSLDVDGSGGLSFEEFSEGKFFKKLPEEKRRKIFDRMDTDGDGEITAKDRPERPSPKQREKKGAE